MNPPLGSTAQEMLLSPIIKVGGTELSAAKARQIQSLRITKALRIASRAVLRFEDAGFELASAGSFSVDQSLEIIIGTATVFSGNITGIEVAATDSLIPVLTVIADDPAYKLTRGTKVRTFTDVTYSDVVSKLAGEVGLRADVSAGNETFKYLMQADTDFGLLCELADRTGNDWWVDDKTLHFKPPSTSSSADLTLTLGKELSEFSVKTTALHPSSITVSGWDPKAKQSVQGTANLDSSHSSDLVAGFLSGGSGAVLSSVDTPLSSTEATELAKREVSGWRSSAVLARGATVYAAAQLKAGGLVEIADVGPTSGKYAVTEVEHLYNGKTFRTRFTAGERRPAGLVDKLGQQARSSFRAMGLVLGVVTAVGNPNGTPVEVKVKFPGVDNSLESAWARLATLGGGKSRGILFMPEVNDEVVVGFEGGDLRRPIVLGGMFNGVDTAPTYKKTGSAVDTRVVTSRLGHTVEFGDGSADADQYIGLSLAGGHHQMKLGKQELTATVPSGVPIKLTSGSASIEITKDGSITMTAKKISLKADTDVEFSGVNVTATANAKFAASGAIVEAKANGQAELSASGVVSIKGASVMVN